MGISDRDFQKLMEQVEGNDQALRQCASQLKRIASSQDATTDQLWRIMALLQAMNSSMDAQDNRIAQNSQNIAQIKKHLGI